MKFAFIYWTRVDVFRFLSNGCRICVKQTPFSWSTLTWPSDDGRPFWTQVSACTERRSCPLDSSGSSPHRASWSNEIRLREELLSSDAADLKHGNQPETRTISQIRQLITTPSINKQTTWKHFVTSVTKTRRNSVTNEASASYRCACLAASATFGSRFSAMIDLCFCRLVCCSFRHRLSLKITARNSGLIWCFYPNLAPALLQCISNMAAESRACCDHDHHHQVRPSLLEYLPWYQLHCVGALIKNLISSRVGWLFWLRLASQRFCVHRVVKNDADDVRREKKR